MVAMVVAMEKSILLFRFHQFHRLNARNQVKYCHGSIDKWLKATILPFKKKKTFAIQISNSRVFHLKWNEIKNNDNKIKKIK